MDHSISRRTFLKTSLLTTGGFWVATSTGLARKFSANEKLNLGVVGTINRARANLDGVQDQNIVALCDIEDNVARGGAGEVPQGQDLYGLPPDAGPAGS